MSQLFTELCGFCAALLLIFGTALLIGLFDLHFWRTGCFLCGGG